MSEKKLLSMYADTSKHFSYNILKTDCFDVVINKDVDNLKLWLYIFETNILGKLSNRGELDLFNNATSTSFEQCNVYTNDIDLDSRMFKAYLENLLFIDYKMSGGINGVGESVKLKKISVEHIQVTYKINLQNSYEFTFNFYKDSYIHNLENIEPQMHIINNYKNLGTIVSILWDINNKSKYILLTDQVLMSKFINYKEEQIVNREVSTITKELYLLKKMLNIPTSEIISEEDLLLSEPSED